MIDYGWVTPFDLNQTLLQIKKINAEADHKIILVGGQAISAWVYIYNIDLPEIKTPALTQDIDFIGNKQDAELLAVALNGSLALPSMDDHTPNIAVISYTGSGNKLLQIDFLADLLGIKDKDIQNLALEVETDDFSVYLLHPLICLQSRLENLKRLTSKRTTNGITQAQVAIKIVNAFFDRLL